MKTTLRIALPLLFCIALLLCLTPATWAEAGDFVFPANTTVIEDEAFLNCAWMKTITIPAGVTRIGNGAFSGCTGLTDVYYGGTLEQWGAITFGSNNHFLTAATLHCTLASGSWGSLTWVLDNEGLLSISGKGTMDSFSFLSDEAWLAHRYDIKKVIIHPGVTSIGDYAFSAVGITSVSISPSVTDIGANAFSDCRSLRTLDVPFGVERIGAFAFMNCSRLMSISLPSSLNSIGQQAFYACIKLTDAVIPEGVTTIGNAAFCGCDNLKNAVISSSVTSIGTEVFSRCEKLMNIYVDTQNSVYCDRDGVVFNKSGTELISFPNGRQGEYIIPTSVTSIGYSAFSNCDGLTKIAIPSGVTTIGPSAFAYCRALTSISIPESVINIGPYAFISCSNLTDVVIPSGITCIEASAFHGCSSLTSIAIPASVTGIGRSAFMQCTNLSSVAIPSGVRSIDSYAFAYCNDLTNITIPVSVTNIGEYAFYNCSGLTDVYYTGTKDEWNAITKGTGNDPLLNAELHAGISLIAIGSSQHILGRPEHLQFRSDIPLFNADVFVDDEKWTRDTQFSLSSDGTILTLDCLALDRLAVGTHSVKVSVYSLNASANFEILSPVITVPEITLQPQSQIFDASLVGWPTFIVHAIGGDLTYTWEYRYNNTEDWRTLCDVNPSYGSLVRSPTLLFNPIIWYAYTSQQGSDLSFHADISYNGHQFRCKVSNSAGVTYSNIATLTVKCTQIFSHITQGGKAYYSTETDHSEKSLLDRHTQYADVGDTVYIRAVPDTGYKTDIQIVSTTDGTGTEIPANGDQASGNSNNMLTTLPDGSVSFVMPATDIDLYVSFRMPTIIASGTWGDLTWTMDEDGLLKISGNGEMSPFNDDDMTSAWHNYSSDIYSVVLDSGVTSIGNFAFNNCSNLKSIAFSKDVANIGRRALDGCSGLIKFEVDEANQAYCDIDGVLFSKSIDTIERYPAARAGAYVIPEGVSVIGDSAFYECKNLTGISIPESVTKIEMAAFSYCSGLDSAILPHGLTSLGSKAFYGCSSLSYIRVYEATTNFGDRAFASCANLKTAGPIGGNYNVEFGWISLIPDNVFSNCDSLTSIIIPDSVERFGRLAFSGCSGLTYIPLPSSLQSIGESALSRCINIKNLSLPFGVTEIGAWAFSNCTGLESAFIPSRVRTLSNRLFSNCSSLSIVSLSDGLESIGEYVFAECSSLSEISIPSTVTSIGNYAFYNCGLLSSITVPESTTEFGNNIFTGCTNLKTAGPIGGNYDYSFGWKDTIPANAFMHCSGLISVVIPESITTIGGYAFFYCNNLTEVELPKRLANINDRAFSCCSSITSVTIPGGVDYIGNYAFESCSGITTVIIEEGVAGIGVYSFYGCQRLTSIAIPNSMQSVGDRAFYNCSSLKTVYYGGTQTQWGAISIGSYNQKLTGAKNKYYNSDGTEANYSQTVSGILQSGDGWQIKWEVLYNIVSGVRKNAFLKIYIEGENRTENSLLLNSTLGDGVIMPWLTEPYNFQKSDFEKIYIVGSIANPLNIIPNQFSGYSNVQTVQLDFVETLKSNAFSDCTSLETVIFDGWLDYIGNGAFKNDMNLYKLYNRSKINKFETIGDEAFMNTGLTSFEFHSALKTIGKRAFQGTQLTSVEIGPNVTSIGENAFNSSVIISCHHDTEAHLYAIREGINCVLLSKAENTITYSNSQGSYSTQFGQNELTVSSSAGLNNHNMALLCAMLSDAAYTDNGLELKSIYQQMFEGVKVDMIFDYGGDVFCSGIALGDFIINGQETNVLVITVRGTQNLGSGEVIADISISTTELWGKETYSEIVNFQSRVLNSLNTIVAKHSDELENRPLKIIVTGHSLGGAAANLIGTMFSRGLNSSESWWSAVTNKADIYAYTFGAIDALKPNGSNYDFPVSNGYENVHNVMNAFDRMVAFSDNFRGLASDGEGKYGHMDYFAIDYSKDMMENHQMYRYLEAVATDQVNEYLNP